MVTQIAWSQTSRYCGSVVSLSWDAVLCLCSAGASFFLLLLDSSPNASLLRSNVEGFLRFYAVPHYGAEVTVTDDSAAVGVLAVSILPQLRYYLAGQEVGRVHGAASYEEIQRLLDLGDKIET